MSRELSDQALVVIAVRLKWLPVFSLRLAGSGETKGEQANTSLHVVIRRDIGRESSREGWKKVYKNVVLS